MNEPKLRLNAGTGYYEGVFTIQIEPEILRRAFFKHVEDNNIDPTDQIAMAQAIEEVASIKKWVNHPRARMQITKSLPSLIEKPSMPASKVVPEYKSSSDILKDELREKAKHLPTERWEELQTPLPPMEASAQEKQQAYQKRHLEKKALASLREELSQGVFLLDPDIVVQQEIQLASRIHAIAEVVNGSRLA